MIYIFTALSFLSLNTSAKVFQNSYVSFEVPNDWNCMQEGVAWTCTPISPVASKEAVIVLAAKIAGPEDNLNSFLNFLKTPKKIATKVGTPMPSQVMYAQPRMLAGSKWIQAQHLGSEIQNYYTLYLATVKDQLAILVSFSADRNQYGKYNPIFDMAMKTLKIVASSDTVATKSATPTGSSEVIGINVQPNPMQNIDMMPPPERPVHHFNFSFLIILGGLLAAFAVYLIRRKQGKASPPSRSKKR